MSTQKRILFKTVHGSHLYGLAHEGSDNDYYTVVDKVRSAKARYARQTIQGDEDSMVVDFGTWLDSCAKGVPQALEAMFSTMPLHDEIAPFRAGFRVGTEVYNTYMKTIKSFTMSDEYKKKRHGLRLAYNLLDIRERGRFDPTLNPVQVEIISELAKLPSEHAYDWALRIAWR